MDFHAESFDEPDLTEELHQTYIISPTIRAVAEALQAQDHNDDENSSSDSAMESPDIYEDTFGEATDECENEGSSHKNVDIVKFTTNGTSVPGPSCKETRWVDCGDSGIDMGSENDEDIAKESEDCVEKEARYLGNSQAAMEAVHSMDTVRAWEAAVDEILVGITLDENYDGDSEMHGRDRYRNRRSRRK